MLYDLVVVTAVRLWEKKALRLYLIISSLEGIEVATWHVPLF